MAETFDHHEKAAILLEEYKGRMGCSTTPSMLYNLEQLVQRNNNMEHVKQMPADKSPGPDGFNGLFIKSCWHIIKEDVYSLCFDFFIADLNIQAINNSFITLIPKVNNPTNVNDFRPISLMNCVLKIITKLMANGVQSVITTLIHTNQYGLSREQFRIAWLGHMNTFINVGNPKGK
jgi:hypothetical protein